MRNPDQKKAGVTCDARVTWADITPTILDYCKVLPPKRPTSNPAGGGVVAPGRRDADGALHGRSFLSVLEQEHPGEWDEIFVSHTFHEVTMYYPMREPLAESTSYIVNFANGLAFPFASDLYASATWQDGSAATTGFTANAK